MWHSAIWSTTAQALCRSIFRWTRGDSSLKLSVLTTPERFGSFSQSHPTPATHHSLEIKLLYNEVGFAMKKGFRHA